MDLVYRYSDKTRIDAIYITSDTEQGIDNSEKSGEAFRFRLTSSQSSQQYTDAFLFFFDEDTDINDMLSLIHI